MIKNFTKKILFILPIVFVIISNISLAQTDGTENIKKLGDNITNNVVSTAITLLMTAAFMVFFYGVVVFIYGRATNSGDMEDLAKGREFMLWGLAALFVMVSVSGIIKLFQSSLDINGSNIDIKPVSFSYSGASGSLSSNSSNNGNSTNGVSGGSGANDILKNPIEKTADGKMAENPFANTSLFPIVKIGTTRDLKAPSSPDGTALGMLEKALKDKKCMNTNSSFSSTYDDTKTNGSSDADIVRAFQKINGLTIDSKVGKGTWEAVLGTTGVTTTFTGIVVKNCTTPVW